MRKKTTLIILVLILFAVSKSQANDFLRAFDSLHKSFSANYPMGKWKAIPWDSLYSSLLPRVQSAAESDDSVAFYSVLMDYADASRDGHVNIRHGWAGIRAEAMKRQIGGSYGFCLLKHDDGRFVVNLIDALSPAFSAGMRYGAEIIEINGTPAKLAVESVSTVWAELVPATAEARMINQCRFIGRAPIGSTMTIKFLNRDSQEASTVELTAADDNYCTYNQTSQMPIYTPGEDVSSTVLQGNIGYIKVTSFYGDSITYRKLYTDFRNAIVQFNEQHVNGLVLDLRMNYGGMDALAAAICGFFYKDTVFYEQLAYYNPDDDSLEALPYDVGHLNTSTLDFVTNPKYPQGTVHIEPQGINFSKPLAILAGPKNISSGEGPPMMLRKLPKCKVISFYGTHASFALVGIEHYLFAAPDDLYFRYPYGVSLDKNFQIQLDSDSSFSGGVMPDIKVPINDKTMDRLCLEGGDPEVDYAVDYLASLVNVENDSQPALSTILGECVPNPVSSFSAISFRLPAPSWASLTLIDELGNAICPIAEGIYPEGLSKVTIDASGLSNGIYYILLKTANATIAGKCIILK